MNPHEIARRLADCAQTAPRAELLQLADSLEQTAPNHPLEHQLATLAQLARLTTCKATRALLSEQARRVAQTAERILEAA
jgi:hypothetical protein